MRVLLIGDIVGKLGRRTVGRVLPALRKKEKIDLVFANAENLTHGTGASPEHLKEVGEMGVDFFTSGNHIFDRDDTFATAKLQPNGSEDSTFEVEVPLIRPLNYPSGTPGKGYAFLHHKDKKVLILNLLGWTFMGEDVGNPFQTIEEQLADLAKEKPDFTFLDFHAEATSEKRAMGFFLDGRATAVVGTHTHVPTADAQILPKGTGYVSDLGMVGARDSVLGVESEIIIKRLKNNERKSFEWVEKGPAVFYSVFLETDPRGLVKEIKRIDLDLPAGRQG